MWFKTEETLTESQVRSALKNIIKDGVASQAMGILTGGVFLVVVTIIILKSIIERIFPDVKEKAD